MVHVGDFGLDWPGALRGRFEARLSKQLLAHEVQLVVSPGNHENWETVFALPGDGLAEWRPNISVLPRGSRTVVEGLIVGALGGAFSVDAEVRTPGKTWWANEEPTAEEAEKLVAGGPVDILITHDAPAGVPLKGDFELKPELEERANRTRILLRDVVDRMQPGLVACGHWHQRKVWDLPHPSGAASRVHVLADENSRPGNAILVWPGTAPLRVEPLLVRGS
jgi:Icc-related predicted phosphoesterase